jgi:integrase
MYDTRQMAEKTHFAKWSDRRLDELTVDDLLAVKNACGAHHVAANRCVQFIRRLFNWSSGKRNGKINFWAVENFAKSVETRKEKPRKRFLDEEELVRFNEALDKEPLGDLRDLLILAATTGARKGDLISMDWKNISQERAVWTVPNPKNPDPEEPYNIALMDVAMNVLERRSPGKKFPDDGFVFPGDGQRGHLVDVPQKPWRKFLTHAQLENFHFHDIRHTVASWMVIAGVPLLHVKSALGHSNLQTTERYSHLIDAVDRESRETGRAKMLQVVKAAKKRAKLAARKPKLLAVARG